MLCACVVFLRVARLRQLFAGSDWTASFLNTPWRYFSFRKAHLSSPPPAHSCPFSWCVKLLPYLLKLPILPLVVLLLISFTNHLLQVTVLKALKCYFSVLRLRLWATDGKVHDFEFWSSHNRGVYRVASNSLWPHQMSDFNIILKITRNPWLWDCGTCIFFT